MQRLEVSCALRLIYTSLGAKGLRGFSLLQKSRPAVGPTQLLTQRVQGFLHLGKVDRA